MKFRSVLSPRKNAQNAPTTPETIITPIAKILVGNTSFRHPAFWYIPKAVPLQAPVILHLKDLSFYTTNRPPEELTSLGAGLSQ